MSVNNTPTPPIISSTPPAAQHSEPKGAKDAKEKAPKRLIEQEAYANAAGPAPSPPSLPVTPPPITTLPPAVLHPLAGLLSSPIRNTKPQVKALATTVGSAFKKSKSFAAQSAASSSSSSTSTISEAGPPVNTLSFMKPKEGVKPMLFVMYEGGATMSCPLPEAQFKDHILLYSSSDLRKQDAECIANVKVIIHRLVDDIVTKKSDPLFLKGLYLFLFQFHLECKHIRKAFLPQYLRDTFVGLILQRKEIVPYPMSFTAHLKGLISVLPANNTYLPVPEELMASDFSRFETHVIDYYRKIVSNDPLCLLAIDGKIIEGKSVIFLDDAALPPHPITKKPTVVSSGFHHLLFAPKSSVEMARQTATAEIPAEKRLAFSLSYSYTEVGKRLSPARPTSTLTSEEAAFRTYSENYGMEVVSAVKPIFEFRDLLLKDSVLSESNKTAVQQTISRLLASYHQYFTIHPSNLRMSYGESDRGVFEDRTSAKWSQTEWHTCVSLEKFAQVFIDAAKNPKVFNRLLHLLEEAIACKLSRSKRDATLAEKTPLPLYDILSCNGVALLATLELAEVHVQTIVENVENHDHLYFLTILFTDSTFEDYREEVADEGHNPFLTSVLKGILTVYLPERVQWERLTSTLVHTPVKVSAAYLAKQAQYGLLKYIGELITFFKRAGDNELHSIGMSALEAENYPQLATNGSTFTLREVLLSDNNPAQNALLKTNDLKAFEKSVKRGSIPNGFALQIPKKLAGDEVYYKAPLMLMYHHFAGEMERFFSGVERNEALYTSSPALRTDVNSHERPNCVVFAQDVIDDGEGKCRLSVEGSDRVGCFDLSTFFASYLNPAAPMFQLFERASSILITTTPLSQTQVRKSFHFKMTPVRSADGHIIDIVIKWAEVTDSINPGTTLQVVFDKESHSLSTQMEAMGAESFITSELPLTQNTFPGDVKMRILFAPSSPGNIYEPVAYNASERFDVSFDFVDGSKIQFKKTPNENHEGWVLIDGKLYKSLPKFVIENGLLAPEFANRCASGWVMNVSEAATKNKARLAYGVATWFYVVASSPEYHTHFDHYFPHFSSTTSTFSDLNPTDTTTKSEEDLIREIGKQNNYAGVKDFFLFFRLADKNFNELISNAYKHLLPKIMAKFNATEKAMRALAPATNDLLKPRYDELEADLIKFCKIHIKNWTAELNSEGSYQKFFEVRILGWLKPKIEAFLDTIVKYETICKHKLIRSSSSSTSAASSATTASSTSESVWKTTDGLRKIDTFLEMAFLIYAKLYAKIHNVQAVDSLSLTYKVSSGVASWDSAKNHIEINTYYAPMVECVRLLRAIARREHFRHLKGSILLVPKGFNSGFLNHELEHARRGKEALKSPHADGYDITKTSLLDFEMCAAHYANLAHSSGLFDSFARAIILCMKDRKLTFKDLDEIIKALS